MTTSSCNTIIRRSRRNDIHVLHVHYWSNHFQATILLDDFTEENGATGVVPGTQKFPVYPNREQFDKERIHVVGKKGSVMLFPGIMQHAAMPNVSNASRTGVIIQVCIFYPNCIFTSHVRD